MKKSKIIFITFLCLLVWFLVPSIAPAFFPHVPNADFTLDLDNDHLPDFWQHGKATLPYFKPSRFGWEQFPGSSSKAIWIIGGEDRQGEWSCKVSGITPHTDYILRFYAHRDNFLNKVYPEVEIFTQSILLDNHCTYGGWQIFELHLNSQDAAPTATLKFKNRFPVKFWFYHPELIPASERPALLCTEEQKIIRGKMDFVRAQKDFFPIGIYGASTPESLTEIKKAGFNTALIPPKAELVKAASDKGIKTIINICSGLSDPNKVISLITQWVSSPSLFAWYIADEPELSPFIPETFVPLVKKLNRLDPLHPTCVAMNRARLVHQYQLVNNLFFLDEYPIPTMPLTWLTESLDQARKEIGSERIWSVVQAFGGPKHKEHGWPRFPSYDELRALTYLSLIHEASGLLYFCYPDASAKKTNWQNLTRIISELNSVYAWLTTPNCLQTDDNHKLKLTSTGPYKTDAVGKPAIHYALKKKEGSFLLLAVNALDHPVEMNIDGLSKSCHLLEVLFENRKIAVKEGNLQDKFTPFAAHIYSNQ